MTSERSDPGSDTTAQRSHGAGMPGDGAGRREEPGRTGVHPASAGWPEGDMEIVREGEWGQGEGQHEGHGESQGELGLRGSDDPSEPELWLPGDVPPAEGRRDIVSQPDQRDEESSRE